MLASYPTMGMGQASFCGVIRFFFLVLCCVCSSQVSAYAKAGQSVAFLAISNGVPDAELTRSVVESIEDLSKESPEFSMIAASVLRKRLGRKPGRALKACGSDLKCIAKLGRTAGVETILYLRFLPAKAPATGITVQLLVLGTQSEKIEGRATIRSGSASALRREISEELRRIFSIAKPQAPPQELSMDLELDLEAIPVTPKSKPPKKKTKAPSKNKTLVSKKKKSTSAPPKKGAPDTSIQDAVATAVAVNPASIGTTPPQKNAPVSIVRVAGIGAGGIGVVGIALGAYYYGEAKDRIGSVTAANDETPTRPASSLREAVTKQNEANRLIDRANFLFAAGGVALAIGATLVVLDVVVFDEASVVVAPDASGSGLHGTLQLTW